VLLLRCPHPPPARAGLWPALPEFNRVLAQMLPQIPPQVGHVMPGTVVPWGHDLLPLLGFLLALSVSLKVIGSTGGDQPF
jgi:hypothetical protein